MEFLLQIFNLPIMIVDQNNNKVVANINPIIEIAGLVVDTFNPDLRINDFAEVTDRNIFSYPVTGICSERGNVHLTVSAGDQSSLFSGSRSLQWYNLECHP